MLRILVVGAGIGGLALTAALDNMNKGLAIDLVEEAERFEPVGAGIVLHPNGMAVLARLGLADEVISRGSRLRALEIVRGNAVLQLPLAQVWAGSDLPSVALHRSELHALLADRALSSPGGQVKLRLGRAVVGLEQRDRKFMVHESDGAVRSYDLIVAADGVNSTVRRAIFPMSAAEHLGILYWRFSAANTIGLPADVWRTVEGRGVSFGFIPLGGDKLHCFVQLTQQGDPPYPVRGEREFLESTLSSVDPALREVIGAIDGPLHMGPARSVRPHRWRAGRCVLLGDAAHAFSPTFSQGGSLAMEDALVLAHALSDAPDFDNAIEQYEAARSGRVTWAARMAMSQVNAMKRGRAHEWGDAAAATEHLRQMYHPLLRDPLASMARSPPEVAR